MKRFKEIERRSCVNSKFHSIQHSKHLIELGAVYEWQFALLICYS